MSTKTEKCYAVLRNSGGDTSFVSAWHKKSDAAGFIKDACKRKKKALLSCGYHDSQIIQDEGDGFAEIYVDGSLTGYTTWRVAEILIQ